VTEPVPLIPRKVLFDNPDRTSPKITPDGERISWLAPLEGVLNVWVAPTGQLAQAKPVTYDTRRGIRAYSWAYNNEQILYVQDQGGDENWHVHAVNLTTGEDRDLTPFEGVNARVEHVSHRFPDEILLGLNNRNPQCQDIHRVNIRTGEIAVVQQNPGMFEGGMIAGFLTDDDFNVRFASRINSDASASLLAPDRDSGWKEYLRIPMEDTLTTHPRGFDRSGSTLYMTQSMGRNTAALVAIDLESGRQRLIAEDDRADAGRLMVHPTEKTIEAVAFNYDRNRWQIIDQPVAGDLDALSKLQNGEVEVVSRTLDDRQWLAACVTDAGPTAYYHWDRKTKKASFLFTDRRTLGGYRLAPMRPVIISSRDGLNLVCYLSLPPDSAALGADRPDRPLPLVLLVHGGPWARDVWGYDGLHQMLANRGYAALSVNFRGSTGLGKSFVNAGNKQWGKKMHDDLLDAVDWAVQAQIADPNRIAIMGGSYGGYATLVGLSMTPDKFACGVDIVGPSSIATLLASVPPYWASMREIFKVCVGDYTTEEGRAALDRISPLTYVENIKKPLLIGQGANDPRVKKSESDRIVAAMQQKNIPATYVLFPDEGHGFVRPENRLAFFAVADIFLARHLGGRSEPISPEDFAGSTIQVPTGVDQLPALAPALAFPRVTA
jgi:dipeptidyl aminopeptidase/acylaminoacyl peptidase